MKRLMRLSWLVAALLLFPAACSLPNGSGSGPRVWIDDPLDGASLELGLVVVRSHSASDPGSASAALLVNGVQVRLDAAEDPTDPLSSFAQAWEPEGPGDYTLEVIATDPRGNAGRSNRVLVHVGTAGAPPPAVPTLTPEPQAMISFTTAVNCRLGPGTAYDVVATFNAGERAVLEGRNEDSSWYWVGIPGSGLHCFVSASSGSLQGPVGGLAIVPVPALPTTLVTAPPVALDPPGSFTVSTRSCSSTEYIVTLQWDDGNGELGYRVYRDGALVATLPANSTTYDDASPDFSIHSYQVQSYNGGESANSSVQNSAGCLY